MVGEALVLLDLGENGTVDPGIYALIGSAAMISGTTRMTVSLAMVILEITGDYRM